LANRRAPAKPRRVTPALPRRHFALLFAALFVVAAGNTALQSVFPAIARVIRIPDLMVAVIFSGSALLWTFSAPYWARQSDVRGRKRLTLIGVAGFGVSMLGCGLAILGGLNGWLVPLATFAVFASLRMIFGIFGSASNPAAQAYIAAHTSEANRTNALSILSSAFGLGTIIGPAVASLVVLGLGLSGPMFVFAGVAVCVLIAVGAGLPDDDPTHARLGDGRGAPASEPSVAGASTGASSQAADAGRPERLSLRDARIAPYMMFGFASGSIQAATGQALGFLIIDRTGGDAIAAQASISIVFMAGAAATLLAQWVLIPRLRMTPPGLLLWGTALACAGTLGIALGHGFVALTAAYALASLGYGLARPGFTAGASLAVDAREQGGVAGAVTAVNGSCFIFAPLIGIGLYEVAPSLPYWLATGALAALLAYTLGNRTLRRERVHAHPDDSL